MCYVQFKRKIKPNEAEEVCDRDCCLEWVVKELRLGMARGEVYTRLNVWQRYSNLMSESGSGVGTYENLKIMFKRQLPKQMPDEIDFIPQLDQKQSQLVFPAKQGKQSIQTVKKHSDECEEMLLENNLKCFTSTETGTDVLLTIHHAAKKIRANLKDAPAHNNCASVDLDHIADIISSSLCLFVETLLSNDSCDDGVGNDDTQGGEY